MIRRITKADATQVATFLRNTFRDDVLSGGNPNWWTADMMRAAADRGVVWWVAIEGGKPVGVLAGEHGNAFFTEGGVTYECNYFSLLAVSPALYQASKAEARRVARELTVAAANDLRDSGLMKEMLWIMGPTQSRGASWCRELGMAETVHQGYSEFRLPFRDIWDRAQATV